MRSCATATATASATAIALYCTAPLRRRTDRPSGAHLTWLLPWGSPVQTQKPMRLAHWEPRSQVSYVGPALSSCLCNRQSSFTPSRILLLTLPQAPGPSNHHHSSPLSLEFLSDFTSYIEVPCNEPSSFTPFHFVSFKLPQATSQSTKIGVQFLYTVSVRFLSGLWHV